MIRFRRWMIAIERGASLGGEGVSERVFSPIGRAFGGECGRDSRVAMIDFLRVGNVAASRERGGYKERDEEE